jgi:class 3 adenylate cyclase/tetratricopeptide (TPR) repeat protein
MPNNLVTLVFTDLVNSTAIKVKLPGKDIAARNRIYLDTILNPHRQRVEGRLADYGGSVVKTQGDAYFLVFGDATQAAQWAVDVQISHTTQPIATPLGPLQVKIGMHTGSPVADGDDFIGHEVDYAAHVAGLATGEQIVLSKVTAALLEAAHLAGVALHAHGERELKGIGHAAVFELLYAGKSPQPLKEAVFSPTNLPPPPDGFIGRADLLAELRDRIQSGGVTILKGEGGIGKTALVLLAAHAAHADGELPGGVAWLNCELQPSCDECLRQMAEVFFGDRMEGEHAERCQGRVMEHLQQCDALVIFDNFETTASDAALLRWLSQMRAPARALVTTREVPPGLRGQVVEIRELPRDEAVALFIERATAAGFDSTLDPHLSPLVNDLCAAVGDQPLAIELLAARTTRLPLPRLLERVRRDLAVLDAQGDPTRPDRHQNMRACFSLSYETLSADARRFLLHLSVLPDGAGVEVITAVMETEDWDEAAEELVTASVWRFDGRRYHVHPLVRQFSSERLGSGRADAERHVTRAVTQLALMKGKLTERGVARSDLMVAALDWMEAEWRNLLACADVAFAAQDWVTVSDLSDALYHFFRVRGYYKDCENLYSRTLLARRALGDRMGEGKTLNQLGFAHWSQARGAEAEVCYRQSLTISREVGNRAGEAGTLNNLGLVYWSQGRWAQAEECYRQSLAIFQEVGDRVAEGPIFNNLGNVYYKQQRWTEAERCYRQSLARRREIGDRVGEGRTLNNLGNVYANYQRWTEAEECYHQCLSIAREVGDRSDEGEALKDFAELRAAQGDLSAALELGRQAVVLSQTAGNIRVMEEAQELVRQWEQQLISQQSAKGACH